jgi:hypothetical protein
MFEARDVLTGRRDRARYGKGDNERKMTWKPPKTEGFTAQPDGSGCKLADPAILLQLYTSPS